MSLHSLYTEDQPEVEVGSYSHPSPLDHFSTLMQNVLWLAMHNLALILLDVELFFG